MGTRNTKLRFNRSPIGRALRKAQAVVDGATERRVDSRGNVMLTTTERAADAIKHLRWLERRDGQENDRTPNRAALLELAMKQEGWGGVRQSLGLNGRAEN